MKRRDTNLTQPLLIASLLAMVAAMASSETEAVRWEPYRFEAASGEIVDAELGSFSVPENREAEHSRQIELSFVRFPSTAEHPGFPIVYLAGGPGGSGISTARGRRFPLFMALRAHADVIALDQRGTGRSNHIPYCTFSEPVPFDRPLTRDWGSRFLEREARRCADFWREQGIDLGGYNTAQSADDLEDLRRALGVEKLNLWGISYGTHLAFAAVARHPGSFDKMILASAEGPDETIKLPARTQAFLERLDEQLAHEKEPGLVEGLDRVLRKLEREPVTVTVPHPSGNDTVEITLGKLDVQLIIGFLIKNPQSIVQLRPLMEAMLVGDFQAIGSIAARVRLGFKGLDGMPQTMDAASGVSKERLAAILDQREAALLGDALNFPMLPDWKLAAWLGIEELPASFRESPRSDVPALFLSGTLDGRTYLESHRALAGGFPNATHIVLEGAGHDLFMSHPEVEHRILEFLKRGITRSESIAVPLPSGK